MSLPKKANVVIIGGGVLGASAAFHLAEAGHREVVLLERGPLASGTTPAAAGQTGYLNSDKFSLEFGRYCVDFFEHFAERTGHEITFHQTGSLRVALTPRFQEDLEKRWQTAQEVGEPAEFISRGDAEQLVPTFSAPTDAKILRIPRDGWVEPKSVAVAFAAAARDRGVEIHTQVHAEGLRVVDGRVEGVETRQGFLRCDQVVLAAGAWTRQFGHALGLNLKTVPVRHQALVTGPLPRVLPEQPIVRITEPQIYVRPEQGGLLVGGYGYRPLSFDMDDFPRDFEVGALPADPVYYAGLLQAAAPLFPSLSRALIVQHRRGLPTITPDGRLMVSDCGGLRGLIVASGCGVGGIDRSPGVGRMVAETVSGEPGWLDPQLISADRFDDSFREDAELRAQCERVYAHHYHQVY